MTFIYAYFYTTEQINRRVVHAWEDSTEGKVGLVAANPFDPTLTRVTHLSEEFIGYTQYSDLIIKANEYQLEVDRYPSSLIAQWLVQNKNFKPTPLSERKKRFLLW